MSTSSEPPFRPEVIAGERIFLSHILRDDIPTYARWFSDLELTTYLGGPGNSFLLEHEQAWFEHMVKDQRKMFSIVVREGQWMIGNIGFNRIEERTQIAELGIAIGDKRAWGQGYGTEALRLICDYGFTFLSLHTIYLWYSEFNTRGRQAYIKAGFKDAGRLRGGELFDGKYYDRVLMDITRAEFGPSQLRSMIGQLRG